MFFPTIIVSALIVIVQGQLSYSVCSHTGVMFSLMQVALMEMSVYKTGLRNTKEEWKSASLGNGTQFVTTVGAHQMLE